VSLHDRNFEARHHRASGLNLVVATIILWNIVYLAIGALRQQGRQIADGLTQSRSARPLEPHQPDRRLFVAAKQTRRKRQTPATQKANRTLTYFISLSSNDPYFARLKFRWGTKAPIVGS
jgi:Tn3 transposase DDE domain